MNEVVQPGRIFFATAIVAPGVPHLLYGRFRPFDGRSCPGETPFAVIPWVPVYPWLASLTGLVLLVPGVCLIANLRAPTTATLLGILFLVFVIVIVLEVSRLIGLGARTTVFETLAFCDSALRLAETSEPENSHKPNPAVGWVIKSLAAFAFIAAGRSIGTGQSPSRKRFGCFHQ